MQEGAEQEVEGYLRRKYTTSIREIEVVSKEDLDLKNHLSGLQRKLLKVSQPYPLNTISVGSRSQSC